MDIQIDQKQALKYGLIALAVILVLVTLIYGVKYIKRLFGFEETKRVDVNWEPTPYKEGGGEVMEAFPVQSYVSELNDVHSNTLWDASSRCSAYERLMDLNDNEFIAVLNKYYEVYKITLRSEINKTWQSGCSIFATQWDNRVLDRMQQLDINV